MFLDSWSVPGSYSCCNVVCISCSKMPNRAVVAMRQGYACWLVAYALADLTFLWWFPNKHRVTLYEGFA